MARRTIQDVSVAGTRVLMRVDFNVPLDADGVITDDRRIRLALPSIRLVLHRGGRLILISHLGRPDGAGFEPPLSLRPAAVRLSELLDRATVHFVQGDCTGSAAVDAVAALGDGETLLLDNLRFDSGEKGGDASFAAKLAAFGDVYCNEAFGTAHRSDASMVAVPAAMSGRPRVVGLLMDKELRYLAETLARPRHPFVAILGGAKVSDKLGTIQNLRERVDTILIGGAMAYTFLRSTGESVGSSLVETHMLQTAGQILQAPEHEAPLLPCDHCCGRRNIAGTPTKTCEAIPDGWMGLDIGPATVRRYVDVLEGARTILWNGPMGVFETPPFDVGTRSIAEAIVRATDAGAASIVGGGDTAAAVEAFGLGERFSHVSTGGGASLRMLEGRPFESVDLLDGAHEAPGA